MNLDWNVIRFWALAVFGVFAILLIGWLAMARLLRRRRRSIVESPVIASAMSPDQAEADPAPVAEPPAIKLPEPKPELQDVLHAFEFGADDRMTIVLEMPTNMLDQHEKLAVVWVDTIAWAQVERLRMYNETRKVLQRNGLVVGAAPERNEHPIALQAQLDRTLRSLKLSSDKRRRLRLLLQESMPALAAEGEIG